MSDLQKTITESNETKEAEKVEDALKDFISKIINQFHKFKIKPEYLKRFERKISDSETLLEVFQVMKNMFDVLMRKISVYIDQDSIETDSRSCKSSNNLLDCSEVSKDKTETFEKIVKQYESEIRVCHKVQKEQRDLIMSMEKQIGIMEGQHRAKIVKLEEEVVLVRNKYGTLLQDYAKRNSDLEQYVKLLQAKETLNRSSSYIKNEKKSHKIKKIGRCSSLVMTKKSVMQNGRSTKRLSNVIKKAGNMKKNCKFPVNYAFDQYTPKTPSFMANLKSVNRTLRRNNSTSSYSSYKSSRYKNHNEKTIDYNNFKNFKNFKNKISKKSYTKFKKNCSMDAEALKKNLNNYFGKKFKGKGKYKPKSRSILELGGVEKPFIDSYMKKRKDCSSNYFY